MVHYFLIDAWCCVFDCMCNNVLVTRHVPRSQKDPRSKIRWIQDLGSRWILDPAAQVLSSDPGDLGSSTSDFARDPMNLGSSTADFARDPTTSLGLNMTRCRKSHLRVEDT